MSCQIYGNIMNKCDKCTYSTQNKHNFKTHLLIHDKKLLHCPFPKCDYSTRHEIIFDKHVKTHRTCNKCGYSTNQCCVFKRHLLTHENDLLCCSFPKCDYSTKSKIMFDQHKITKHTKRICKLCGFSNNVSYVFNRHMETHRERKWVCSFPGCGFKSVAKYSLTIHKDIHLENRDRLHKCTRCDYSSFTAGGLSTHIKTHIQDRKYICSFPECGRKFLQRCKLDRHHKDVHEEKTFFCDFPKCGYKFSTEVYLKVHQKLHLNPSQCDLCNYSSINSSTLKIHKNRHLGIKPHKCDFPGCEYKFATPIEVICHKRTHTPEGQIRRKKQENRVKKNLEKWGYTVDCETTINAKRGNCLNDTQRYFSRIDFHVINCTAAVLLLEVDENQHLDYLLPCEFSRMADVQASLATVGITKPVYWIRYNPNGKYHVGGEQVKIGIKERESELKKKLEYLCSPEFVPENKVNIHYMFYDLISEEDGPEIMIDTDFPDVLKEFVSFYKTKLEKM